MNFINNNYSYVDNKYGLNVNRVTKHLDSDIAPDMSLEGMRKLAEWFPIDMVGEYYGIGRDNKNNIKHYIGKGIANDEHIDIVERHFEGLGMPIPGGFRTFEDTTLDKEPTPVMEDVNKQAPAKETWIKNDKGNFVKESDIIKEERRIKEQKTTKSPEELFLNKGGSVIIQPMQEDRQDLPTNVKDDGQTTIDAGAAEGTEAASVGEGETISNQTNDVKPVTKARGRRPVKKD